MGPGYVPDFRRSKFIYGINLLVYLLTYSVSIRTLDHESFENLILFRSNSIRPWDRVIDFYSVQTSTPNDSPYYTYRSPDQTPHTGDESRRLPETFLTGVTPELYQCRSVVSKSGQKDVSVSKTFTQFVDLRNRSTSPQTDVSLSTLDSGFFCDVTGSVPVPVAENSES